MRTRMRLLACVAGVAVLAAAPAQAEDLLDIYQLAAREDAQLQAAQADFQATGEFRPQAWSALLPQVNLSGQYIWQTLDSTRTQDGLVNTQSGGFDTDGYTLRLDQVIYDHSLIVQLWQADSSIAQAQAELDAIAQALVLRVSEAYFNVLAARDGLQFAVSEKKAIGRQLEQARKRFEVGMIAITDVKEARAAYDLAVAQQVSAQNQLAVTREALQVITGQLPGRLRDLQNRIPLLTPDPADVDQWVRTANEQNLQLIAAQFATETASLEVDRRRAGHYPTLGLFAQKAENDSGGGVFGATETDDQSVGLELNIPIFSGGFVTSSTREASYLFEQSQDLQELQRREAIRQTRASYLNVIAGISRVKALRQALASNRAAAAAARAGFRVGTRTSVDVLLALRETFRTQRDLSRARYNYLLNTLRLKQAAGTLGGNDLVSLNDWLY
ncbi:MAG: TolC family outer membrane protein [Gammaproteobacteria bacterium]|nr:TolC family outer membrane protein [Gammaproteobacteria bacterium]